MLDTWKDDEYKPVDPRLLIDRAFMIYLSLMEDTRSHVCVFPYTPSLSCMIEHGWLANFNTDKLACRGSIRLAAPERTEVMVQWEDRGKWEPKPPQEPPAVSGKKNKKKRKKAPL